MAETSVSFVVGKLGEFAMREAAVLLEVGNEVVLLRDNLEWLQTFLKDADQKRRIKRNQFVGVWVRQVRDVAFDVEDALDEYSLKVDLESLGISGWKAWFKCAAGLTTQIKVRHNLSTRIQTIKKRLEEISANKTHYEIEAISSTWTPFQNNYAAWHSMETEARVVGFRHLVKGALRKSLLEPGSPLVHCIVGQSGTGKTTLAKKIYNKPEIKNHFTWCAWIQASAILREGDLLHQISRQIPCQPDSIIPQVQNPKNKLKHTLSNHFGRKKYLLVFDGFKSMTIWDAWLHDALPDEGVGSKVIITTQKESRVITDQTKIFRMEKLKENEITQVFCQRVFNRNTFPKDFDDSTKNAVIERLKTADGLPLAAVTLAGILRTKESPEDWKKVLERIPKKLKPVDKLLSFSFDDLPPCLKPCFLYLAAFSKDYEIDAQKLVRLWIAEGFIQLEKGRMLEEVGQAYLKELISRCMVVLARKDNSGRVEGVSLHGRFLNLALQEAHESSFLEVHDKTSVLVPGMLRRLSLRDNISSYTLPHSLTPKLRSILCHSLEGTHALKFMLHRSKFLRVIDLNYINLKKLPEEVGTMIHLRYLGLRQTQLERLPQSIANLCNLQTLDIRQNDVREVPQELWNIQSLRHLLADHLLLANSTGILYNLDTLLGLVLPTPKPSYWFLSSQGERTNVLLKMPNLHNLKLSGLLNSDLGALPRVIENLEHLDFLDLEGEVLPVSIFNLSSLRRHLFSLRLCGRLEFGSLGSRPIHNARYILPKLSKLVLELSNLPSDFVEILAKLPSLADLVLKASFDTEELVFPRNGFRSLINLEISDLRKLVVIRAENQTMPQLKRLAISNCEMVAVVEGLQQLKDLKTVELRNVSRNIAELIQKEKGDGSMGLGRWEECGGDFVTYCCVRCQPSKKQDARNSNPKEIRTAVAFADEDLSIKELFN